MIITRLSWAGLQVVSGQSTLLIDAVEDFSGMEPYMGKPLQAVIPFSSSVQADLVLLTHLHPDHFDPQGIRKALKPGGRVVCHTSAAEKLEAQGFPLQILELNQAFSFGDFTVIPVFGLDGIGHEQVSWVVRDMHGKQLFHGGDTIWHSRFWEINRTYGKTDAAFLPINGVVVDYAFVGYNPLPASLTPEQAVVAAKILQADILVPMHYGTFHKPQVYEEYPSVKEALVESALAHNQQHAFVPEGGSLELSAAPIVVSV
ncbi:L-ascorbate metabolism protein UlaG (beta-lactamase superfamily) [Pontibacter ummariensis]|uniref:L-ascorbate metabolism protein UlaG, beta-lactamase superfamily n=1 Tax=Pontibacter ummariensis TaxID=1610492 RepID=A0A239LJJ1_9BACT|nr:MBL fold metallo-hydrolase [Pontibacter ummariensis]PRY03140.1 L-ascorbate metabolism protein UlaG (beta-lactamase superfamily) [Pontibacter ummariensis]SNT30460.1 L-ascorbate metabolism protein UlaG, beta-lactamase superfamily [Pontibacter ummariensis]